MMIDCVVMNQCRTSSTLCAETFGKHCHNLVEFTASEIAVRPGGTDELEEFILIQIFRRSCGNDLLRQYIQRFFGNGEPIKFAAINTTQQGRALDQFIAAQRENPAFRQTAALMLSPADTLQQCGYRAGRAQLANEINRANINSQLERSRSNERFQVAALQPV